MELGHLPPPLGVKWMRVASRALASHKRENAPLKQPPARGFSDRHASPTSRLSKGPDCMVSAPLEPSQKVISSIIHPPGTF